MVKLWYDFGMILIWCWCGFGKVVGKMLVWSWEGFGLVVVRFWYGLGKVLLNLVRLWYGFGMVLVWFCKGFA